MEIFTGKGLLERIAVGKIYLFKKETQELQKEYITDVEEEKKRFHAAREAAMQELQKMYDDAKERLGEEKAQIFKIHRMLLEDLDYIESTEHAIEDEQVCAEYAVSQAGNTFSAIFASMDDAYMKERAVDILDVTKRVVNRLSGAADDSLQMKEPSIIFAEDLTPSETIQMEAGKILAFVTQKGSTNSHTAILASSMNIPAVVKADIIMRDEYHGQLAIVDGMNGKIYVNPTEEIRAELEEKKRIIEEKEKELNALIGQETRTTDGKKIHLYANIGSVEDAEKALENDAEGIGLFRSEFLYIGRNTFPTEEEQFEAYKAVLEKMNGKKVVIRTLDIGADKKADYFHLEEEENPALGYRAIRICLTQTEIFKTQLRALYRAAVYGNLSIMFPMIISLDEVLKIKEIIGEVKEELKKEQKPFGIAEIGIMIETPAAALISDELAKEVEFFSIGSNDLTQYTLAIDRQNEKLDRICDTHHRAILKLIEMTVTHGHREGIWVGVCGELAADTTLTEQLINMGIDELSVSASHILRVRKKIRGIGKGAEE